MRQGMYLLACLFITLSCTKTNLDSPTLKEAATIVNQSNQDHEYSVSMVFDSNLNLKVFCGGTQVDVLSGHLTDQHCTMFGHYTADGFVSLWMIHHFYGEMTSQKTGEVFKMNQIRKVTPDMISFHYNLIGDQGTHYIASGTIQNNTWTVDKALCLENGAGE